MEQSIGTLSWLVTQAAGMKKSQGVRFTPGDFMPNEKTDYPDLPEQNDGDTLDGDTNNKPAFTRLN